MDWLRQLRFRILGLARKRRFESDMADEMRAHIEMETVAQGRRGLGDAEARAAARRAFGAEDQIKERCREQLGFPWLERRIQDIRYGWRMQRRTPVLSAVIVLSLALGVGANTAIFSWMETAVFHPLAGVTTKVVCVEPRNSAGAYVGTSWPEYRDLTDRLPSFAGLAAQSLSEFNLGDNERGERVWGELVSGNFFSTLGVRPALGRFFRPDEVAGPSGTPVAVVSDAFWRHHLGGAPGAIGLPLKLNNRTLTVIGVAPPGFVGAFNGLSFDVWVPLTMSDEFFSAGGFQDRSSRFDLLVGTLRRGATAAQARAELGRAARDLAAQYPRTNAGIAFDLMPAWLAPRSGAQISAALAGLQALGVLVLIVVCFNTANLLLARATVRQREIGIRLALGASAPRIFALLLTESLGLALAGAIGGWMIAAWGVDGIRRIQVPTNWPVNVQLQPHLDFGSFAFAVGLAAGCGIAAGLAPALQLIRADVVRALRAGGPGAISGRGRLRSLLIAGEVAVAILLVALAALFLKSFHNAQALRPGYDPDRVLMVSIDLAGHTRDAAASRAFAAQLLDRLERLPAVESAAVGGSHPLLDAAGEQHVIVRVNGDAGDPDNPHSAACIRVSRGYFATLGMGFVAGGDLAPLDQADAPLDAVVNEEFTRRYMANAPALGSHVQIDNASYKIVGVVHDAKYEQLGEAPQPAVFPAARPNFFFVLTLYLRPRSGDPLTLATAVRDVVRNLDPQLAPYDPRTLAQHIDQNLYLQRVPATILSWVGPLALGLAAIGLYAVLAYTVAQRTREIGVRLALGATPRSVVRLVIRQGMGAVWLGTALGWGAIMVTGWHLHGILVNVSPADPEIYVGVPALLLGVALLACWLSARRAAEVDPLIALRAE